MIESEAASYLAGALQTEGAQSSSPTNLHVITGEVVENSYGGKVLVNIDGRIFSESDSQNIIVNTIGGLKTGDIATVILAGQENHAMVPLAIGAVGSADRISQLAAYAQEQANIAKDAADQAVLDADTARSSAYIAQQSATEAAIDAENAAESANNAAKDAAASRILAEIAQASADSAQASADVAFGKAEEATQLAQDAFDSAIEAKKAGDEVLELAKQAEKNASNALENAIAANASASGAAASLSTVEDVLGTLGWIATHGTYLPTEDVEIQSGKAYYIRETSESGEYVYSRVTPEINQNPKELGWFELEIEDALADYVNQHLALMDDGLHVVPLEGGYYVVLSNDGMGVYDPESVLVSWYGKGMQLGSLYGTHMEADGQRLSFFTATFGYPRDENGDVDYSKAVDGKFSGEVAYIAIDENGESIFYMNRAVVMTDLRFGNWKWYERSNRNLALKWIGD